MCFKKNSWIVMVLVILFVIVGCSTAQPTEEVNLETSAEQEGSEEIKMAVLLSGTVDDLSWNYQMQQAALQVAEENGFEVDFSEKVPASEVERVIREYADTGYNFIITHSFSYGETLFNVAPDYPDVYFAWPGGIEKTAENIADYDQPFYQAAYILGVEAGGISESGVFSFLSGFDIPVCHSMYEAFKLGAQVTNPDAEVLYTIVGDWADVAKAKEAVLAHVDAGADYVASCGFGPTLGAIEAAEESDIYASSYVGDMSSIAPDNVALNMVWDLYPLVTLFVDEIEAGTFMPGKYYSFGVADDALRIEVNSNLTDVVPAEASQQAADIVEQIKSGSFEVPYIPEAE
jgi:simple sugar transport system substrate-binding protein/basic membrane protein A